MRRSTEPEASRQGPGEMCIRDRYEAYFNGYTPDNTTHVMSVTKSILSALIGIAIDLSLIHI